MNVSKIAELITAPRSHQVNELESLLTAVGWNVRRNENYGDSACCGNADVRVVLLGDADAAEHERLRLLIGRSALPSLAVLPGLQSDWDRELLNTCAEFVRWPCHPDELSLRLDRLYAAHPRHSAWQGFELARMNLVGDSPAFLAALNRLKRFSGCAAPVLIQGESGTGKELAARAVHYESERRDHPFVAVNCGALPDDLMESELFGHEKGAFTGAAERRHGLVTQAQKGTLFLDEVETLSRKGQIALLRFLQDQEYRPVGAPWAEQANVRVIAASNADLQSLVADGCFREDLLFRLNVLSAVLPALRDRPGDVKLLAQYFMSRYRDQYREPNKQLHPATLRWMEKHAWRGNVRELENFLHRAFVLAEGPMILAHPGDAAPLPECTADPEFDLERQESFQDAKSRILEAFEHRYLSRLLADAGGNVSLAARRAGKERRALGKLLKKHGIDKSLFTR